MRRRPRHQPQLPSPPSSPYALRLPLSLQDPDVEIAPASHIPVSRQTLQVRQQLHAQLSGLSFLAFEVVTRHLLSQMGYTQVQMMGRTAWHQRTSSGGLDMAAYAETGVTRSLIIVQLKLYSRPVQRRFVDELRGTMLRMDARQGLLITTSTFPRPAKLAAASNPLAPISLIDGEELLDLLFTHQVGVRKIQRRGRSIRPLWTLDRALFKRLHRAYPKPSLNGRQSMDAANQEALTPAPQETSNTNHWITGGEMTWRTHVLAGISSLWLLEFVPKTLTVDTLGPLVVLAGFGALLPDLDAGESKIKHLSIGGIEPFSVPAVVLNRTWGHRGVLHSAAGLGLFALLNVPLALWLGWLPSAALILGYASHLAADACTRSGIPLLYPKKKRYHLLPPGARFVTGSLAEQVLFPFLISAVVLLLLYVAGSLLRGPMWT